MTSFVLFVCFNWKVNIHKEGLENKSKGASAHLRKRECQSCQRDWTEFSNTCICLGILLFPKYRFSPDPAGLGKDKLFVFFAEKKIKNRNSCLINVMIIFLS